MMKVEQHIIQQSDSRWSVIDEACFKSKNLFNATLYILRQTFFDTQSSISYTQLARDMKRNIDYRALPRKVSQWVLRQVSTNWQSSWAAHNVYQETPHRFSGRPNLPGYKHKTKGRNLLIYTVQALSKTRLRKGIIAPSRLNIEVQTQVEPETIRQVRIVPPVRCYLHPG